MPRTSASQPRKGSTPARPGGSTVRGKVTSTGRTMSAMMRGISRSAGLADLTRIAAEQAEKAARSTAAAAGKSVAQVRAAGRAARAESIKATASRAAVSPTTARRWASGTQRPRAATEQAVRGKQLRAMGGARRMQAQVIVSASRVNLGTVNVRVSSGGSARTERRDMYGVEPSRAALERVAALMEEGRDDEAEQALNEALVDGYDTAGAGLAGFMQIEDLPDPVQWS